MTTKDGDDQGEGRVMCGFKKMILVNNEVTHLQLKNYLFLMNV